MCVGVMMDESSCSSRDNSLGKYSRENLSGQQMVQGRLYVGVGSGGCWRLQLLLKVQCG